MDLTSTYEILVRGKKLWTGKAIAIHMSPEERKHNSIQWLRKHSFDDTVVASIDDIPPIIMMEWDQTLWLGSVQASEQGLRWKFKPKGARCDKS